ncbi:hypothetical protein JOF57_000187 [Mycolicibacterium lutetiense]|uniref:Chaperone protein HchA n=1 Tax=Mycolicibacterium lutetiense TaxID=1641992 RepID=A0ABS4ZLE2_9MYCO|nr:hypothetical protein [Mycolicibacterium lutetiense]
MSTDADLSRELTPDQAEDNAFFPSPYSLSQYTSAKTDFAGVEHKDAYTEGRWKVLMIATEERYVLCQNGKMFSTGNHPVEMLLPLHHLMEAGFGVEVATISGYPAKLALWALPREDAAVMATFDALKPKLKQPRKLSEVVADLHPSSDYLAVFVPGGHGAVVGLPGSVTVGQTLNRPWTTAGSSSPCATVRRHCWPPTSVKRSHRWPGTRCACSLIRSTRAPTSRSAIYPGACNGSSPICWPSRGSPS